MKNINLSLIDNLSPGTNKLKIMENAKNVISGTLLIVQNIKTAVNIINRYVTYEAETSILFKDDKGESVSIDAPSLTQISKLAKDLLAESTPYQNANLVSFATQVAFYFPEANLYEIFLLSVANIVGGEQEHFSIS